MTGAPCGMPVSMIPESSMARSLVKPYIGMCRISALVVHGSCAVLMAHGLVGMRRVATWYRLNCRTILRHGTGHLTRTMLRIGAGSPGAEPTRLSMSWTDMSSRGMGPNRLSYSRATVGTCRQMQGAGRRSTASRFHASNYSSKPRNARWPSRS